MRVHFPIVFFLYFYLIFIQGDSMRLHDDPSIIEIVASLIALMAVGAIIWSATVDGSAAAQTALTGLVGASASFFLTPKGTNGNGTTKEPSKKVDVPPTPPV
jgi:hypothetical protein